MAYGSEDGETHCRNGVAVRETHSSGRACRCSSSCQGAQHAVLRLNGISAARAQGASRPNGVVPIARVST